MIVGESGNILRVNIGVNITTATELKLNLNGECTKLVKTLADGVSIGLIDYIKDPGEETEETYLAGQYVIYTFKPGDITVSGVWKTWLAYRLDGKDRISDPVIFDEVEPLPC